MTKKSYPTWMLSSSSSDQQDNLWGIQHRWDGRGFISGAHMKTEAIRIHKHVNIGPDESTDIISNSLGNSAGLIFKWMVWISRPPQEVAQLTMLGLDSPLEVQRASPCVQQTNYTRETTHPAWKRHCTAADVPQGVPLGGSNFSFHLKPPRALKLLFGYTNFRWHGRAGKHDVAHPVIPKQDTASPWARNIIAIS